MTETTAAIAPLHQVEACVFDAYGTLLDVGAAAEHCRTELGDRWLALAELWRSKQLQYSWLRSLMGRHADFWQVTGEALDFALAALQLGDLGLRDRLMQLYLRLDCYAEVPEVLRRLKASGRRLAILSNGTPEMLRASVQHAGIADVLEAVISVEQVGVYKPHPAVYQSAVECLKLPVGRISFQSSNGWDAHGARTFGYPTVWINRFGQAPESLPGRPDAELRDLRGLPALLGVT